MNEQIAGLNVFKCCYMTFNGNHSLFSGIVPDRFRFYIAYAIFRNKLDRLINIFKWFRWYDENDSIDEIAIA